MDEMWIARYSGEAHAYARESLVRLASKSACGVERPIYGSVRPTAKRCERCLLALRPEEPVAPGGYDISGMLINHVEPIGRPVPFTGKRAAEDRRTAYRNR